MTASADKTTPVSPLKISRRSLLMALPLMPLAMRSVAQQASAASIPVSYTHLTLPTKRIV